MDERMETDIDGREDGLVRKSREDILMDGKGDCFAMVITPEALA